VRSDQIREECKVDAGNPLVENATTVNQHVGSLKNITSILVIHWEEE
jgi:hypothetical protein